MADSAATSEEAGSAERAARKSGTTAWYADCNAALRIAESPGMSEQRTVDSARTIDAAEFEARCLSLIDEVAESGESITITKDGRPMSRLVPCAAQAPSPNGPPFADPWGADRGKIWIAEGVDIVEGSVLDDDWEEQWERAWDDLLK